MSKHADNFRQFFQITEEDRRRLTPEQLRELEEWARQMANDEIPTAENFNKDKFDAFWMEPTDGPPPPWREGAKKDDGKSRMSQGKS